MNLAARSILSGSSEKEISGDNGVTFYHHDAVGAKMTRKRMTALKYSAQDIDEVASLVFLHLRFHTYQSGWSDSAVRRYVRDAGPLLEKLNELTLCDSTTRNQNKVKALRDRMSELKVRIAQLREQEELNSIRPEIDGSEVMNLLDIPPSRTVGEALDYLLEIRLEEGILGREEIIARLKSWWEARNQSYPDE